MSNCSTVWRSQHSGGGNTLVRHCSWAIRSAVSSSGAQDRCTCTASRLPSPPLSRKAAIMRSSFSRGWLTVTRPSAHVATQAAVSSLIAGPIRAGGSAGRVHRRARSTRTRPSWSTTSPANSARMISTHSSRRALRTSLSGHAAPVMCSLDASPVPRATHRRPGNISVSDAAACATMAGW